MKNEYIICSAIWFQDGNMGHPHQPKNIETGYVICGRRHHNCFSVYMMIEGLRTKNQSSIQGFLTNYDRFVDRKEAAEIAFVAEQIQEQKDVLYSEDIY